MRCHKQRRITSTRLKCLLVQGNVKISSRTMKLKQRKKTSKLRKLSIPRQSSFSIWGVTYHCEDRGRMENWSLNSTDQKGIRLFKLFKWIFTQPYTTTNNWLQRQATWGQLSYVRFSTLRLYSKPPSCHPFRTFPFPLRHPPTAVGDKLLSVWP